MTPGSGSKHLQKAVFALVSTGLICKRMIKAFVPVSISFICMTFSAVVDSLPVFVFSLPETELNELNISNELNKNLLQQMIT